MQAAPADRQVLLDVDTTPWGVATHTDPTLSGAYSVLATPVGKFESSAAAQAQTIE